MAPEAAGGKVTIEAIKTLTGEQAMLLYRQYSDEMWAAGWMGSEDEPPFKHFVSWLLTYGDNPAGQPEADYEIEFAQAWDKWRKE